MSGIVLPFTREGSGDFAVSDDLFSSKLSVILGSRCADSEVAGEFPWNQALGSRLSALRYRNVSDETTKELAVHYVVDAVKKNLPGVKISGVSISLDSDSNKITIKVRYTRPKSSTETVEVTL